MTEQTNPKKEQPLKDEKFPGYPHYPDKEDIMNSNENERIEMDLDNVTRSHNHPLVPLDRQAELLPEEEPRCLPPHGDQKQSRRHWGTGEARRHFLRHTFLHPLET